MEEERRLWKNLKQIVSGESPESKEEVQEAVEYVVDASFKVPCHQLVNTDKG